MKSHRQIFRSSAIIGGSSVINIIIGIVKVKVLAVLLGPAGIGLMGIYQNIMGMASTISGCGVGTSGVRQIAASSGEEVVLMLVRRSLLLANLILGLFGMLLLWFFREPVTEMVLGDTAHAWEVGWLGFGVFLSLVASSQTALLQGLRRIGDLARVSVTSAIISALVGIAFVYYLGESGVIWFVLITPLSGIIVAAYYTSRLPRSHTDYDWYAIKKQWEGMLRLGLPVMFASLLTLATQLIARSIVLQESGIEATGYFQAAWTISMTYIGFVLGAMGADYYPRLTEAINEHQRARQLVNEQTEMALLLAGPFLLAMITLAPWVIHLLYTEAFSPAVDVLRWQMLGNILKVVSWPMGFIILASGRGGVFIFSEFIWNFIFLLCLWYGLEEMGLLAVGVGFFIAYLIYVPLVRVVANKLIGFTALKVNISMMMVLLILGGLIIFLASVSLILSYSFGIVVTLVVSFYSLRRLDQLIDLSGWLQSKIKQE